MKFLGSLSCSSCSVTTNPPAQAVPSTPSECCTMKIQPNNTYYWSLFKSLKENLDKLINESQAFLTSSHVMCGDVESSYAQIEDDLATYLKKFTWEDEFYA